MIGGPWLGVAVFVVIAVGLGWGLTQILQAMLAQTAQTFNQADFDHGFDPDQPYLTTQPLLLGYFADGRVMLLPGKKNLPPDAPGRFKAAAIDDYRDNPDAYRDLIAIVEPGTALRFTEVIDDRNNAQSRILVKVELLTGPHASKTPLLGLHLESADINPQTDAPRYAPRDDLFTPAAPAPVQSPADRDSTETTDAR